MNPVLAVPGAALVLAGGALLLLALQGLALRQQSVAACRAAALAGLGLMLAAWEVALLPSSLGGGEPAGLGLFMGQTRALVGGAAALLGLPTALAGHRAWGLGSLRAAVIAGIGVGVGPALGLGASGLVLLHRLPGAPGPMELAVAVADADRWVVGGATLGVATALLLALLPDQATVRRQRYAGL